MSAPAAAGATPAAAPPPDLSPSIAVAKFNIRCGRAGGLESALRAMEAANVDVGILTETKLTGGIYTRFSSGYQVLATDANSAWLGGVALFWRESLSFVVEEPRVWGSNVISFELVTGRHRYYCMGCYIPPSDHQLALPDVQRAWSQRPKRCEPLLFGDLNFDLKNPEGARAEEIAEVVDDMGVKDMLRHFSP